MIGFFSGVINRKATPAIMADVQAARPVTAPVGTLFIGSDTATWQRYNGSAWVDLGFNGDGYVRIGGNDVTNSMAIGTNQDFALVFKTNNLQQARIQNNLFQVLGTSDVSIDGLNGFIVSHPNRPTAKSGGLVFTGEGVGTEYGGFGALLTGNTLNYWFIGGQARTTMQTDAPVRIYPQSIVGEKLRLDANGNLLLKTTNLGGSFTCYVDGTGATTDTYRTAYKSFVDVNTNTQNYASVYGFGVVRGGISGNLVSTFYSRLNLEDNSNVVEFNHIRAFSTTTTAIRTLGTERLLYSELTAATGKGTVNNLWCVGTASSYHAGNVGIGITPTTTDVLYVNGNFKTALPAGGAGTPVAWRFGNIVTAAAALDATRYIEVSIGGTLVKLAIIT